MATMTSTYTRLDGVRNTLYVPANEVVSFAYGPNALVATFGTLDETQNDFQDHFIAKQELKELLEARLEALKLSGAACGDRGEYISAGNYTVRAQEIFRLLRDIDINEIDQP
jgi:hypothetical protein